MRTVESYPGDVHATWFYRRLGALLICIVLEIIGAVANIRALSVLAGVLFVLCLVGWFAPESLTSWGTRPGDDAQRMLDRVGGPEHK